MSRPSRVRALALLALTAAAGCQDYNFNPVGHCIIQPGSERVPLSGVTRADVLFVVDDSGSMGGEQAKLAANFQRFIENLNTYNANRVANDLVPIDFHLAITTTSVFYNAPTGAQCRSDCPNAIAGTVCCNMNGDRPSGPYKAVQKCTGATDNSCPTGTACRNDCKTLLGEYACCNETTKVPAETAEVACAAVGSPCGTMQTHYLWNAAAPACTPGSAAGQNERPYPAGAFVGLNDNPRVLHFDKSLYDGGTTNSQGFTAADLMGFFQQNVQVGTCGSGQEQGLQAARLAVEKALGGEQLDARDEDGNPVSSPALWLSDPENTPSKLVVVFVGDEDDCSSPPRQSEAIVLSGGPGADACVADQALPQAQRKQYDIARIMETFANVPGDHPLGAAFIVSARNATTNNYCVDETCVAGVCCDTACTGSANVCTSITCGGQAPATRLLEAAGNFRALDGDVVAGSICDNNFGDILSRIADVVKPPTGLQLPSAPAASDVAVVRIAGADGKTRKTCRGPAPAGISATQALAEGWDWWFTATRDQLPPANVGDPDPRNPTGPSRFVFINQATNNCTADVKETYSADYLGRLPAQGCTGATPEDADANCVEILGGQSGSWTCFAGVDSAGLCTPPTGGVVGTCICGARGGSGTGNCPLN